MFRQLCQSIKVILPRIKHYNYSKYANYSMSSIYRISPISKLLNSVMNYFYGDNLSMNISSIKMQPLKIRDSYEILGSDFNIIYRDYRVILDNEIIDSEINDYEIGSYLTSSNKDFKIKVITGIATRKGAVTCYVTIPLDAKISVLYDYKTQQKEFYTDSVIIKSKDISDKDYVNDYLNRMNINIC